MADVVSIHFDGEDAWKAALDGLVEKASAAAKSAVSKGGLLVEAAAKAHANGRPGPQVRTGSLRRSIVVVGLTPVGPTGWMSQIAPTIEYGRRIELGFSGTDSAGRHYGPPQNPATYPFLAPGLEEAGEDLQELYKTEFAKAMEE